MPEDLDYAGWDALACAIVRMACIDYRVADQKIRKTIAEQDSLTADAFSHRMNHAIRTKRDVIRFLKSEWYSMLCGIDSELILAKLHSEEMAI
jgi:isoleucyl-tRNA synthetase